MPIGLKTRGLVCENLPFIRPQLSCALGHSKCILQKQKKKINFFPFLLPHYAKKNVFFTIAGHIILLRRKKEPLGLSADRFETKWPAGPKSGQSFFCLLLHGQVIGGWIRKLVSFFVVTNRN